MATLKSSVALPGHHEAKPVRIIPDWTTTRGGLKGPRNLICGKAIVRGTHDAAKAGKEIVDCLSSSTVSCDCK